MSKKQKSKYCQCKKARVSYTNEEIVCSKCWKPIKLKIRKIWTINPHTRIKESDKKYNRKRAKRKLRKQLEEENGYIR